MVMCICGNGETEANEMHGVGNVKVRDSIKRNKMHIRQCFSTVHGK